MESWIQEVEFDVNGMPIRALIMIGRNQDSPGYWFDGNRIRSASLDRSGLFIYLEHIEDCKRLFSDLINTCRISYLARGK